MVFLNQVYHTKSQIPLYLEINTAILNIVGVVLYASFV